MSTQTHCCKTYLSSKCAHCLCAHTSLDPTDAYAYSTGGNEVLYMNCYILFLKCPHPVGQQYNFLELFLHETNKRQDIYIRFHLRYKRRLPCVKRHGLGSDQKVSRRKRVERNLPASLSPLQLLGRCSQPLKTKLHMAWRKESRIHQNENTLREQIFSDVLKVDAEFAAPPVLKNPHNSQVLSGWESPFQQTFSCLFD